MVSLRSCRNLAGSGVENGVAMLCVIPLMGELT